MSRIEHNRRTKSCHDRQGTHIGNKRIIAERNAAFCRQHIGIAAFRDLGKNILHVPRRQKLALLDVHDASSLCRSDQQIGLTAEERRNLQDINHGSNFGTLLFRMDIGQHWKTELFLEIGEDFHCLFETDTALGLQGGTIGLVEARLVDQANPELVGHFLETASHIESVFTRFHLARACDQSKRRAVGESNVSDFYG